MISGVGICSRPPAKAFLCVLQLLFALLNQRRTAKVTHQAGIKEIGSRSRLRIILRLENRTSGFLSDFL